MDITTMREEPLLRKCCFCVPLRLCLPTWALIKVVADVLAIGYLLFTIVLICSFGGSAVFRTLSGVHVCILLVAAFLVDVGFLITLIVGVFKKSFKIIRVFYFFELYVIVADTMILAIICVNAIRTDVIKALVYAAIGIIYILLDVCICITVKSEMIKLRNKDQYEFSQMPATATDVEDNGKFIPEEE